MLVNLELDFPVCFYNGMDIVKTGLQFAFPIYSYLEYCDFHHFGKLLFHKGLQTNITVISSGTSPSLLPGLKLHEAIRTAH